MMHFAKKYVFFVVIALGTWPGRSLAHEEPTAVEQAQKIIERQTGNLEQHNLPWLSRELRKNVGEISESNATSSRKFDSDFARVSLKDRKITTTRAFLTNSVIVEHANGKGFSLDITSRSMEVLRQKAKSLTRPGPRPLVSEHVYFGKAFGMPGTSLSRFEIVTPETATRPQQKKTFYRIRHANGSLKRVSFRRGAKLQAQAERVINHH